MTPSLKCLNTELKLGNELFSPSTPSWKIDLTCYRAVLPAPISHHGYYSITCSFPLLCPAPIKSIFLFLIELKCTILNKDQHHFKGKVPVPQ